MNNIIEIYEEHLKLEQVKLIELIDEIAPLERKKALIEKNIESLEHLIKSNQ